MATLQLSLKKKWFDMTVSGEKTEDYREATPYWCKRLLIENFNLNEGFYINNEVLKMCGFYDFKKFTTNKMTLGYPKSTYTSRIAEFEHLGIEIREGREEWGAEKGKLYFVIKHGKKLTQNVST